MDEFYCNLFTKPDFADNFAPCTRYPCLWKVITMSLIMSHGNACVEGGFSVNKELLLPNLLQESIEAQRQILDGISAEGCFQNVALTKELFGYVRMARRRYRDALDVKHLSNPCYDQRVSASIVCIQASEEISKIQISMDLKRQSLRDEEIVAQKRIKQLLTQKPIS